MLDANTVMRACAFNSLSKVLFVLCLIGIFLVLLNVVSYEYWIVEEVDLTEIAAVHLEDNMQQTFSANSFKATVIRMVDSFKFTARKKLHLKQINQQYIIGLPTIIRHRGNYFRHTLERIFWSLRNTNISFQLIVQIGEKNNSQIEKCISTAYKLVQKYGFSTEIEIIFPNPTLYNILEQGSSELDNWKRKLFLDVIHLLLYVSTKSGFYLHLEDDLDPIDNFLHHIEIFRKEIRVENWIMLEYSTLGFMGKMLKMQHIPKLLELIFQEMNENMTGEDIIDRFIASFCTREQTCAREMNKLRLLHRPSLFQHIGHYSSWPGAQWTNCSDANFPLGYEPWPWSDVPIYVNPPARISTTLQLYHPYSVRKLYAMTDVLLAKPAKSGDVIYFNFTPPVTIEEFFIRTSHHLYPNKGLSTGTLIEVLPLQSHQIDQKQSSIVKSHPEFITVGQVNDRGIAEGPVGEKFGKLRSLRLLVTSNQRTDVLIKEMIVKLQIVPSLRRPCCEAYWPNPFSGAK